LVADYDHDGLSDILVAASSNWWWARSTGNGFANFANTNRAATNPTKAFIHDLNGDGRADIGSVATTGSVKSRAHASGYADFLLSATDAFGNQVTFGYKAMSNTGGTGCHTRDSGALYPMRPPRSGNSLDPYLVCTATSSNGIGGTYQLSYDYFNGGYDMKGRGFLGFSKREVRDNRKTTLVTEELYYQNPTNWQYIGLKYREILQQASTGSDVLYTNHTLATHTYGSGSTLRRFPYFSSTVVKRYEMGGAFDVAYKSATTTTRTVDAATGTVTNEVALTAENAAANGLNGGGQHTRQVEHTTLFTDTTNWCIGRPQDTEETRSHTLGDGAAVTRTQSVTWEGATCRPTQIVAEPASTQWKVTTALTYDDFGNLATESVTGLRSSVAMPARTTTTTWDSTGRFPESVKNALNQITQYGWNLARGTRTSQTDPNGILTTWVYDNFGRKTRVNKPDGTATLWTYQDCATAGCLNTNNKMTIDVSHRNTAIVEVSDEAIYLDSFDRPIGVASRMLSGDYSLIKREYDSVGRVRRESAPCIMSSCSTYWTTNTYDALDRVTLTTRRKSDSDATLQNTNFYYEGLTTRTTDPLSKESTQIATALGEVARTVDHNGYYQAFSYEAFGNVKRVTDSAGVVWQTNTYNARGMLRTQTDADRGAWAFAPDSLGELASQTDAKGVTTTFNYDKLGRLTSRVEPEGTSTFTWGTSAAAFNIGQLASMSSPGYSEAYTYNADGRLITTSVTSDTTYAIDIAYNNQGKLHTVTYPTSTSSYRLKLQYDYQNGQLLRVKDFAAPTTVFWEASATDARGHVIDETLGNGLQTVRTFDRVTGWADTIETGPVGTSTIQNLSYVWDAVGNLEQRQDMNQSLLTETFDYDNLHRLVASQRNGTTNHSVAYALNGNITSRSDAGNFNYDITQPGCTYYSHAQPHAVRKAGTTVYCYDANGNMTKRGSSTVSWYSYNLPNTIDGPSGSSQFFYGPGRARYKQVADYDGTSEMTLYVGGLLEKMTRGTATEYRHYIAAGPATTVVYTRRTSGTAVSTYRKLPRLVDRS
jgi:YD repeat-containing protein